MTVAALIGTGMVTGKIARAVAEVEGLRLKWVYARRAEAGAAFVAENADLGAQATQLLDDISGDPDVDMVIIATPPDARAGVTTQMAAAGKAILMEKPLERSLAGATGIVETCEAHGVPLGVFLQYRMRPGVADLRGKMATLGPLRAVEVNVPWWRPQSYYDAPGRGTYARDGGGVLLTQAIHTLDLLLSFTGPVSEVTAMAATTAFHDMEAEDFVTAGLRFANGAVGQLFATTASYPGRGETITLHCQNGSAHLEAGTFTITWTDGTQDTLGAAASSGAGANPMGFTHDWHRRVIADFVEALRAGRPPFVTGRSALSVHALIDALERSAKLGQRVTMEA